VQIPVLFLRFYRLRGGISLRMLALVAAIA
jgi:hypothetical protein